MLVFSVVTDHLDIKLINSAWIYSLIGLGSFIPANFLSKKNIPNWLGGEKYGEVWVAFLALGLLLVSRVGFVNIPTISIAALLVFIGGIANGSVAVTTRSIRRKVCTDNEFAEIVAFENIFGFFIQSVTKYICLFLLAKQVINYESGIYISCAGILMTALLVASLNKKYGEFIYVR